MQYVERIEVQQANYYFHGLMIMTIGKMIGVIRANNGNTLFTQSVIILMRPNTTWPHYDCGLVTTQGEAKFRPGGARE